ncbi:acetylcholine receptor subunit alpha-like 1 [Lingula anatina]|uniref:Acetylcholine receptor subunit alpha-like 1 n=1 Tax=Lingula anatina TaxID=7574 RepID=A0A1S3HC62_LINAN|nr:acetylcholine receptor subunit alpha-like 1 [Lingula anatina]|eukprot:XP_013383101.1 acetylcholine receptor subunit alpha-like 1 [Lingula anatina]
MAAWLWCFVSWSAVAVVLVQGGDIRSLYADLFRNYFKDVRPSNTASEPAEVTMSLGLRSIDFDPKKGALKINALLKLTWIDYRLRWYPPSYKNADTIYVNADKLWLPDIVLYNAMAPTRDVVNALATVSHDGHVVYKSSKIYSAICDAASPSTVHQCNLKFGSWIYSGDELDLVLDDMDKNQTFPYLDTTDYVESHFLELISTNATRVVMYYACCPEPYVDVQHRLNLRVKDEK